MDIVVGTAGHIDHGKTALIKRLTGIDTDRLPEEKQRGITIDLGFAELKIGGIHFGFVDVPGHERFVKNMLAGVSGIDIVLLTVAANEGVMPQTREHFEICRLLGTRAGLVVLTKSDLVDDETVEMARIEIAELVAGSFLERAPILAVSSKTGQGFGELREVLQKLSANIPARANRFVMRLPIDRSFTVKGFGTVVTGTLASAEIGETDELEILPTKRIVRVRGLQNHGRSVSCVSVGQRAAVNLGGVAKGEVDRGMMLASKDTLRPAQIIDVRAEMLAGTARPLRSRQRVRLHVGTSEVLSRVLVMNAAGEIPPGGSDLVQLRLETPIAVIGGERFIIRSYSPQITIGGGCVLDPLASKHRRKDISNVRAFLGRLEETDGDDQEHLRLFVETYGEVGAARSDLQARTGWRTEILNVALQKNLADRRVIAADDIYISDSRFAALKAEAFSAIERHHRRDRLSSGISKGTFKETVFAFVPIKAFSAVLADLENEGKIVVDHDTVRAAKHETELRDDERAAFERLTTIYDNAGLEVPRLNEALNDAGGATLLNAASMRKIFDLLLRSGKIVKINEDYYISRVVIYGLAGKLREHALSDADRSIDVPKFKEIAGISRKYAIPLLEYFDREKITRRVGDRRIIL